MGDALIPNLPNANYGFLGLGNLGFPMAQNLRKRIPRASKLIIYEIDEAQADLFVHETMPNENIMVASSPKAVAERADFVIIMLSQARHVKGVFLDPVDGLLAARVSRSILFMDCSTIDTSTSNEVHEIVTKAGHRFCDAPVSGGHQGAVLGILTFMIGGSQQIFCDARPLAEAMGGRDNIYYCGKSGSGLATKQINNYLGFVNVLGAAEAFNMGRLYGLDTKTLARVIKPSTGVSYNSWVQTPSKGGTPKAASESDFEGGFSIELCRNFIEMAASLGDQVGAKSVLREAALKTLKDASEDPRCKDQSVRSKKYERALVGVVMGNLGCLVSPHIILQHLSSTKTETRFPLILWLLSFSVSSFDRLFYYTIMMAQTPASRLSVPQSSNTVRLRLVDSTALMTLRAEAFLKPVMPGHELMSITDVAFLVENDSMSKKAMFDLGVRKDYWNLPPVIQKRLSTVIPGLRVEKDVTEILKENKINLSDINDVIWSHTHWDHIGNTSLFPSSTSLTYGPGVPNTANFPPFPKNSKSALMAADFEDRHCTEITFDKANPRTLQIGPYLAYDFYGDHSFYLLNTPGHLQGHMCGLARTTPDTFVLMGGDVCHFSGDIRPSPGLPLPSEIPATALLNSQRSLYPSPCPCSIFTEHHPQQTPDEISSRCTPWYRLSEHKYSSYANPPLAQDTIQKLEQFDANPNVLVCLAHDPSLLRYLPTINKSPDQDLNDWKKRGWKELVHWGWLGELPVYDNNGNVKDQGREKPIVEGYWRDGKLWDSAQQDMAKNAEQRSRAAEQGKL